MTPVSSPPVSSSPVVRPFELRPSERRHFAVKPRLGIAEWAKKHLKIVDGPLAAGAPVPWTPDSFPPQKTVMESCLDPRWGRTVVMGPPQAFGKTVAAALCPVLFNLHHRGMSAAYVAANANLARTQWSEKFAPTIEADSGLRGLAEIDRMIAGDHSQRRFANGTTLHMTGAESVGNLSGYTVACLICDDAHAYPATVPGYGHPGDYAESRLEAYAAEQRTQVIIGTASTTDSWLYRTLAATALYALFVPCLACETLQMILWERMVFDEDDSEKARCDCRQRCANAKCDHAIGFEELPEMLRGHAWVAVPEEGDWITGVHPAGLAADREEAAVYPRHWRAAADVGFWANAFTWPLGKSWGERAADFLAFRGQPDKEKNWQQNVLVRPWAPPVEDTDRIEVADLETHASDFYTWRTVPGDADLVTLAIDVHARFLYYIVEGWRKRDGENYLVDAGTIGVHGPRAEERLDDAQHKARIGAAITNALADAFEMERAGWPWRTDKIHATVVLIDGGYRPDVVGPFCQARGRRKWRMVLGKAGVRPIVERTERRPRQGFPHWILGVDSAKLHLRDMLSVPRGHPGYCHVYADHDLAAYHRHLASEEYRGEKTARGEKVNKWVKRENSGPNHWWDCKVYGVAAALMCGVAFLGQVPRETKVITNYFAQQKKRGV